MTVIVKYVNNNILPPTLVSLIPHIPHIQHIHHIYHIQHIPHIHHIPHNPLLIATTDSNASLVILSSEFCL